MDAAGNQVLMRGVALPFGECPQADAHRDLLLSAANARTGDTTPRPDVRYTIREIFEAMGDTHVEMDVTAFHISAETLEPILQASIEPLAQQRDEAVRLLRAYVTEHGQEDLEFFRGDPPAVPCDCKLCTPACAFLATLAGPAEGGRDA
jgi:hypothetical protein